MPTEELIARAAADSPLTTAPSFSDLADADELRFREEIEAYPTPREDVVRFIEGKELTRKLDFSLRRARLVPAGTIIELGAGTCWLSAWLSCSDRVERAVAIEFSRRRLAELAPIAIAHLGGDPHKIERRLGDFFEPGVPDGQADFVFTDAAYHHAADPIRLAQVAHRLLRPGGHIVLFREPTVSLLRRERDHGSEGEHGSFEHEYRPRQYLRQLTAAGFVDAVAVTASGGWSTPRARALLRPPLAWLNGVAFAEFTYVARKAR